MTTEERTETFVTSNLAREAYATIFCEDADLIGALEVGLVPELVSRGLYLDEDGGEFFIGRDLSFEAVVELACDDAKEVLFVLKSEKELSFDDFGEAQDALLGAAATLILAASRLEPNAFRFPFEYVVEES